MVLLRDSDCGLTWRSRNAIPPDLVGTRVPEHCPGNRDSSHWRAFGERRNYVALEYYDYYTGGGADLGEVVGVRWA